LEVMEELAELSLIIENNEVNSVFVGFVCRWKSWR